MKAWMALVLASALLSPPSILQASRLDAINRQAESSMLVTGTIDITPEGTVAAHALDEPGKLPGGVVTLLSNNVPDWRFEPILVDGRPVPARVTMSVRIGARRLDDGGFEVGIRRAAFGAVARNAKEDRQISLVSNRRPDFPRGLARAGITGTVYTLLRVAPDGTVADALAEQVNLRTAGDPGELDDWRKRFAETALAAARRWRFEVDPGQAARGDGHRVVRIPIDFLLPGIPQAAYGQWDTYLPGPVARAAWQADPVDPRFSPDAMVAGRMQPAGSGPKLLTPLGEG